MLDNKELANKYFSDAERLFFAGNINEAVELVRRSNDLMGEQLNASNFFKENHKRMISFYKAKLPDIPYVQENEDIIRILLAWIGLNSIKPKYQLLEVIPYKPIEWAQWDNEVLPKLSKRVHIEKRKASDLLYYLKSYGYRQYIFDTIAERNSPDLVLLINDTDGTDRAILASSIVPSDLPPLRINCRAHVNYIRLERFTKEQEVRYGKVFM